MKAENKKTKDGDQQEEDHDHLIMDYERLNEKKEFKKILLDFQNERIEKIKDLNWPQNVKKEMFEALNNETILCSFNINQYRKNTQEQRVLCVTTCALYDLNEAPSYFENYCERKIPIEHIKAVGISRESNQLVFHDHTDYDYRISSANFRNEITDAVIHAYLQFPSINPEVEKEKEITVYFHDTMDLNKFERTKSKQNDNSEEKELKQQEKIVIYQDKNTHFQQPMTLKKWEQFRSIDFSPDSSNDKLRFLELEKFQKLFKNQYPNEVFKFSCKAQNNNIQETNEEINLLVTNEAIYHLNQNLQSLWSQLRGIIARRVPISLIKKISVSLEKNQFILHIPAEYDIWITADQYMVQVIGTIAKMWYEKNKNEKIKVYFMGNANLFDYVTFDGEPKMDRHKNQKLNELDLDEFNIKIFEFQTTQHTQNVVKCVKKQLGQALKDFKTIKEIKCSKKGCYLKIVQEINGTEQLFKLNSYPKKELNYVDFVYKYLSKQYNLCTVYQFIFILFLKVACPYILPIEGHFWEGETLYVLQKYIDGKNLYKTIGKGRFTEEQAKSYAVQLIIALQYLHSNQIIINDLTGNNIMLDGKGKAYLKDDLSCQIIKRNEGVVLKQTPEFMAPYQVFDHLKQKQFIGNAKNWYSLGVIIFYMLHGQVPHHYKGNQNFWKNMSNQDKEFHEKAGFKLSEEAEDFLKKIMAKNLNDAIKDDQLKNHDWFKGVEWKKYNPQQIDFFQK